VLVGAPWYNNGEEDEGAAFLFLGSASGLAGRSPGSAAAVLESNQLGAYFGYSVSGAGDVNGDGDADVLVGAYYYDNSQSEGGAAFLFLGNAEAALSRVPRLYCDDSTLIGMPGINAGTKSFRVQMEAANPPTGAMAAKLEWEVKPYGTPFDGIETGISLDWINVSTANYTFDEAFTVPGEANGFHWRARLLYLPLNLLEPGAGQTPLTPKVGLTLPPNPPHGPWFSPQWATVGPSDFRTNGYRPPMDPGGVQVTQTDLRTTDDIVATVTVLSTSPAVPPKAIQYEYTWSNGSRTVVHVGGSSTDTLSASETRKHEVWTSTVRAWDGVQLSHGSDSDSTPEIQNTPPEAPTISLPMVQGNAANLIAQITAVSADPDFDAIRYDFDWYVQRSGETSFSLFRDGAFSPNISSQVNDTDTAPGDLWYVIVTPFDGEENGASITSNQCEIKQGGVEPSFLFLAVSPSSITLGESVTLTGQISPVPAGSAVVTFVSTSPAGTVNPNKPEGVATSNGAFSRVFYPDEASDGAGHWSVTAAWSGDDVFSAASSNPVTFTVAKAQPTLSVELSSTVIPEDMELVDTLTATVQFSAALPDALQNLLDGRAVRLLALSPQRQTPAPLTGTTDDTGRAVFDLKNSPIAFTAGTWQFRADFSGDSNFLPAASTPYDRPETPRLTVKSNAGYAVLVVGRLDANGEGQREHNKTGDFIYRALRDRGFTHDDIFYLRGLAPGETLPADITVDDTSPTQSDVASAITDWAAARMTATPAPLYVVFVNHGSPDAFYVYSGSFDETRIITPTELAGYFDTLEDKLPALDDPTRDRDIVFVYGACRSGTFIDKLSGPGRIIITSSAADQVSYRGVVDPEDGIREGEAFLTEFFRYVRIGKSLAESFQRASDKIAEYTATGTNSGAGGTPQTPLLDDNGDRVGSSGTLAVGAETDGTRGAQLVIGFGVNAATPVSWIGVSPTRLLEPDALVGTLEALADARPATGHQAWIEVKTPAYAGGTAVDPQFADSQEVVDLSRTRFDYEPGISDLANGYFRWSSFGDGFTQPGTYQVFYFVQDAQTGEVSSHLVTTVYRTQNTSPPNPVHLIYPEDGAEARTTAFFAWESTSDPDGDSLTYTLEVAEDAAFTQGRIVREGLTDTITRLTPSDGIQDLRSYYWRVIPVDQYGASPVDHEVRQFRTNNDNPELPGLLAGVVVESANGNPIPSATVEAVLLTNPFVWQTTSTMTDGSFLIPDLEPGIYDIEVSATGFQSASAYSVSVASGWVQQLSGPIRLSPVSSGSPMNIDGVGDVNAVDVQLVINAALSISTGFDCDVNDSGNVDAVDVQLVINAALGKYEV
ncbi:MAG: carboxypeptidase regulatory-like domain-containing protein, partial [Candidatus Hydrogenedentes bacterium]|nr:carboxypeptidase regulatory-like domain-containing protein [Candidatus Hydrogenedentota bacterium]